MAEIYKENALQKEAFELYYHLGDKRSLRLVAEKIGRTERTVAGWSRAYSWVDRVSQREIEENKNTEANNILAQTIDAKTRYRIMMNNLLAQASKKIANGELAIRNIPDLERVVKLDLLLMGESTEREENIGSTELSKADRERLEEITRLLKSK